MSTPVCLTCMWLKIFKALSRAYSKKARHSTTGFPRTSLILQWQWWLSPLNSVYLDWKNISSPLSMAFPQALCVCSTPRCFKQFYILLNFQPSFGGWGRWVSSVGGSIMLKVKLNTTCAYDSFWHVYYIEGLQESTFSLLKSILLLLT